MLVSTSITVRLTASADSSAHAAGKVVSTRGLAFGDSVKVLSAERGQPRGLRDGGVEPTQGKALVFDASGRAAVFLVVPSIMQTSFLKELFSHTYCSFR